MSSNFKDFLKAFSANHDQPEQQAIPDSLENSVKEPSRRGDNSDIYTESYKPSHQSQPVKRGQSVIQSDMIVHGSVETKSDIEINGMIDGNIISEGKITINGVVRGGISGQSVSIGVKELNANIEAKEKVVINRDTVINGNINAGSVAVGGTVNGNINATDEIVIMASATVTGDLKTASIEVNRGAVINGNVSFTKKEVQ